MLEIDKSDVLLSMNLKTEIMRLLKTSLVEKNSYGGGVANSQPCHETLGRLAQVVGGNKSVLLRR